MTGCGLGGANQLAPLSDRSKQRAWDKALSKTRRDFLLGELSIHPRSPERASSPPPSKTLLLECRFYCDQPGLHFTWTTTPSEWQWLFALERRLLNCIFANDPSTGWVAPGPQAPGVTVALNVTPISMTCCGGRMVARVSKKCWSPRAWTGEMAVDLMA